MRSLTGCHSCSIRSSVCNPSPQRYYRSKRFVVWACAQPTNSTRSSGQLRPQSPTVKQYDVLALSNVCVDIVIPVDELPPNDKAARQQLLQQLSADPPPQKQWELGGNCNFAIAASRLGMRTGVLGHVGNDVYGSYLEDVLQVRASPSMHVMC